MEGDRIVTELMSERRVYINHLVDNGKITEKTARCLVNHKNEVPLAYRYMIKDLYEKAEYGRLNNVCESIIFLTLHTLKGEN